MSKSPEERANNLMKNIIHLNLVRQPEFMLARNIIKRAFAAYEKEVREDERKKLLPKFIHTFNSGHEYGHHCTVEGGFVLVDYREIETYHEQDVEDLLVDILDDGEGSE